MSEENKAVIRRYFEEARNKGDLSVVDEIFSGEFIRHTRQGSQAGSLDAQKDVIVRWRTAFPDYQDMVLSLVAEGDWVTAHSEFTTTKSFW